MIRRRIAPYVLALLVAIVLSLLPPALFADLATPFESWENWYWRGQPHARPRFTANDLPPALRSELVIFKTLAAPPSWVREKITGNPTVYGAQFGDRRIIYETANVPPLAFAISHVAWALPVWFAVGAALYEVVRGIRSRANRRHAVAS